MIAYDPCRDSNGDPLQSFENKRHLIRDHVTAVARGYKTGYYLYGTGGVSKSYTVLQQLEQLGVPYQVFNSRMTGKGLFLRLMDAPDMIHLVEDCERVTKDPHAQGVFRSALWAQPGQDRIVTWTTATEGKQQFVFTGGLILISNRPLADLPELRALATRIEVHRLDVSDAEVAALMREIATKGYSLNARVGLSAEDCLLVTEYLLKECRSAGCRLDLRLQQKAFASFAQHAADYAISHWQDLVSASVREASCHFRHEPNTASPEDRKSRRRNVVREILAKTSDVAEQIKLYIESTGTSRADFFRRKGEVLSREFDDHDKQK